MILSFISFLEIHFDWLRHASRDQTKFWQTFERWAKCQFASKSKEPIRSENERSQSAAS